MENTAKLKSSVQVMKMYGYKSTKMYPEAKRSEKWTL